LPARWLSSSIYNGWPHCQQDDCQARFTTADHIASKMTFKLRLQQLTTLPARWLSSSVYNSWPHCQQDGSVYNGCGVTPSQTGYAHILYSKPEYLPTGVSGKISMRQQNHSDANFLVVFHRNYGSILP